uniref:Glycoprotein n=1 Tax=Perhabdovirus trutta TaxID=179986 RepID=A0A6M3H6G2_9RHAB|nr:glycoprotein [Perhabdovirus trutta]
MDLLLKILLIIIIIKEAQSRIAFVPLDLGTWRATSVDQLDCPMQGDLVNQGTDAIEVQYQTAAWGLKNNVAGKLCVTAKWSITCDYRWYGSKYISTQIEYLPTTPEMCKEAKRQLDRGELLSPHFSSENCGWNNVLTESETYTTIVPHPVKLDAYSLTLIDNIFEGGKCHEEECPSLLHQGFWIADKNSLGLCKQLDPHIGRFFKTGLRNSMGTVVRQQWDVNSVFQPEIGREKNFNGACTMEFCGHQGLRFADREWFKIPEQADQTLKKVFKDLPPCGTDNLVHSHDINTDVKEITEHVHEVALHAICLQEVRRAKDSNTVSDWLLSMMTPFSEGAGPVYRIHNGELESTVGFYRKVLIEGGGTTEQLGIGFDKKPIKWDQFVVKTNDTRVQSMYNGNTVVNGEIHWAKNVLGSHILDEIAALEFDIPLIQHPHLDGILINETHVISSHHPNGKGVNFVESVTHWAGGIWESVGSSAIIIAVILVVGFVLVKLCMRFSMPVRRERREEGMMMLQRA